MPRHVLVALALCLPVVASAQAADPAPAEAPDAGVALEAVDPPIAAPDAGTPAAVVSAPDAGVPASSPSVWDRVLDSLRPYVTFKPTVIASSRAVESFSQPNASAVTAAGNPVLSVQPDEARLTFQVAQTRVGLMLNEKGVVRGHLEIDFIDFTKASPTTASLPRLRVAKVEWAPVENFTLAIGQDWDLHAPVNPQGSNMVGANFLSGNTGFMRQQIKAIGVVKGFELGAAIGMEGVNTTSKDNAFELSLVPTFALRASWLVGGRGRIGVSGLATSLRLFPGTPSERRTFAGAVTAFADVTLGDTTLRGELMLGQNASNIGMLGLGWGAAKDISEWGGFVSVRHAFTPMHAVYAHGGIARVLNRSDVRPSYGYASLPADGSPPPTSSAALTGTGHGLRANGAISVGYELRVHKHLGFLLEGGYFYSEHVLQPVDEARFSGTRDAFVGELATVVAF